VTLSFVVPAHNEIVVVDDGSTDATATIAAAAGARVVQIAARQISASRNAGARAATGDALVFVDADTLVSPAVVRAVLAALQGGAAGGGATVHFDGRLPGWTRWAHPLAIWATHAMRMAPGCFVFCSRAAFDASGGWDEGVFAAEELYMSRALRRVGRFVMLRETVLTSGRRLRAYGGGEIGGRLLWLVLQGRRGMSARANVADWYDARRPDPDAAPGAAR
jgi:glycosyltransferase involved in cell wall biosynthesis